MLNVASLSETSSETFVQSNNATALKEDVSTFVSLLKSVKQDIKDGKLTFIENTQELKANDKVFQDLKNLLLSLTSTTKTSLISNDDIIEVGNMLASLNQDSLNDSQETLLQELISDLTQVIEANINTLSEQNQGNNALDMLLAYIHLKESASPNKHTSTTISEKIPLSDAYKKILDMPLATIYKLSDVLKYTQSKPELKPIKTLEQLVVIADKKGLNLTKLSVETFPSDFKLTSQDKKLISFLKPQVSTKENQVIDQATKSYFQIFLKQKSNTQEKPESTITLKDLISTIRDLKKTNKSEKNISTAKEVVPMKLDTLDEKVIKSKGIIETKTLADKTSVVEKTNHNNISKPVILHQKNIINKDIIANDFAKVNLISKEQVDISDVQSISENTKDNITTSPANKNLQDDKVVQVELSDETQDISDVLKVPNKEQINTSKTSAKTSDTTEEIKLEVSDQEKNTKTQITSNTKILETQTLQKTNPNTSKEQIVLQKSKINTSNISQVLSKDIANSTSIADIKKDTLDKIQKNTQVDILSKDIDLDINTNKTQTNELTLNKVQDVLNTIEASPINTFSENIIAEAQVQVNSSDFQEASTEQQDISLHNNTNTSNTNNNSIRNNEQLLNNMSMRNMLEELKEKLENFKPPLMKVSLEINPAKLGKVEVEIVSRGNSLYLNFNSNQQALSMMTNNMGDFKQALQDAGFKDVALNFSQGNFDNQSNSNNNQEQSNQEQNFIPIEEASEEEIQVSENTELNLKIPLYI